MKLPRFEYHAPDSLDEVVALLGEHGDEAKLLAGGQSLMPLLAMRLARPAHLVDLNRVTGFGAISTDDGVVRIPAMTRERAVERSAEVAARVPLLAEALPLIGHVAIRNRGTVGGSLAHADASAELPAVAVATDATLVARSTRGTRTIPASEFFVTHFTSALEDDECLVEVRFPTTLPDAAWAFEEVARRHGDFALVGVGTMVRLDAGGAIAEARIAMLGVGDRPVRASKAEAALIGVTPSASAFTDAAAEAVADIEPASDVHGSAAFRRHLAKVTVRRALTRAAERAGAAR